ncbi:poly(U)-specific endoribonuclease-A-like [Coturnix japonica]|uniref:Uridylate-specific endoribonuclease n=1 Tax=Coturnix japonica TaxID=93934 RepID=A0A8C2SW78_COTJA|nr:poly(U)-specific endoribonuclease-A-like [Coturnix japonica]
MSLSVRAALCAAVCAAVLSVSVSLSDSGLRHIAEQLYAADRNRAAPGELRVRLQQRVEHGDGQDHAPLPLFDHVSPALLSRAPYPELLALLDNYEMETGRDETETEREKDEQTRFIDAVMDGEFSTALMDSGLWPSRSALRSALHRMWFGRYSRSGGAALDSSGFEHVFVGELKKGRVSGCHSWLQLLELERRGRLNYLSYSYKGGPPTPSVLGLQFRVDGHLKSLGSTLLGSSPALDLALYSLCFTARPDRVCNVTLGGQPVAVQTYSWDGEQEKFVASAYPISP